MYTLNRRFVFKLAIAMGISITLIMLYQIQTQTDELSEKISAHSRRADSLRNAVKRIDEHVRQKDSILLQYLSSLENVLVELNKESAKNKKSIVANFAKQDSIRKAYCREMERLNQHPQECR